jgi:hypothetical protein
MHSNRLQPKRGLMHYTPQNETPDRMTRAGVVLFLKISVRRWRLKDGPLLYGEAQIGIG